MNNPKDTDNSPTQILPEPEKPPIFTGNYFDGEWVPNPLKNYRESPKLFGIISADALDSMLTNPWLISILVAALISMIIATFTSILNTPKQTELTLQQQQLQELKNQMDALGKQQYEFQEYLTRNDYTPGLVNNPGLLQATTIEAAARYQNRVQKFIGNTEQHPEFIKYGSEIEALKRINLGASGKEAQLKYLDPTTGKWTTITIEGAELAASGLLKLNIIATSRSEVSQRFDLITIAQNTITNLQKVKDVRIQSLQTRGLVPVADELLKIDLFGKRAATSQEVDISNYEKPPKPPLSPPKK